MILTETSHFVYDYFDPSQDLIGRKLALSQQTDIPDMAEYAEEWNRLAADFEACGLLNNAADCRARWQYYRDMAPGAYERRVASPFAVLAPRTP